MTTNLQLDRSQSNLLFLSWRLTRDIVKGLSDVSLAGSVVTQATDETDYVHTRFGALHNHLLAGKYVFLRTAGGLCLQQLDLSGAPSLSPLAVLGEPGLGADGQVPEVEAALPPSVAEIRLATEAGQPQALLVSKGHGDLALLLGEGAGVAVTAAVHPLQPEPPLQGVRPFYLEAAMQLPGSTDIRCVLWAVGQRTDVAPSRCEVFAVTLAVAPGGAGGPAGPAGPELHVKDVQLLRRSALTPHGVVVNPEAGALLLALDPAGGDIAEASCGVGQAPAQGQAIADGQALVQLHPEPVDDSGDPVSPRTLQAAVARLAQFTSEEPAGGLPPNQWADLYSESGPDGVGDLGQEPACVLFAYDAALSCVEQVACLPHKVLTCNTEQGRLLLGLTDDVDCAVVEVAPTAGAARPAGALTAGAFSVQHTASVPALAYVAAGKLQRKFLLLTPPGASLAAALVESHCYAYLYRPVQGGQECGEHEVVELRLAEGCRGVLGAALVAGHQSPSRLLLLTSSKLRMYEL